MLVFIEAADLSSAAWCCFLLYADKQGSNAAFCTDRHVTSASPSLRQPRHSPDCCCAGMEGTQRTAMTSARSQLMPSARLATPQTGRRRHMRGSALTSGCSLQTSAS